MMIGHLFQKVKQLPMLLDLFSANLVTDENQLAVKEL
jgi:hypothetical protein